jgi:hypothetical protein
VRDGPRLGPLRPPGVRTCVPKKRRNNEKPAGLNRVVLIVWIERNNEGHSDSTDMKYRDIEYTVVQGLGRQLWKWGFALDTKAVTGQAATKAEAVAEAERAIDRALAPKKLRLVPRPSER